MEITGIRTHILIGKLTVLRTPMVWVDGSRHKPLSRAGVVLADPEGEIYRTVKVGDAMTVRLGYLDQTPAEWRGTVVSRRRGNTIDQVTIEAVGEEAPLSTTIITQAWENETPEAIVRWAVGRTGLPIGRIDSPGVTFPRFMAAAQPVWSVAGQCGLTCSRAFGLDMRRWALWMDGSGLVNWGDFEEAGDLPVIGTAEGLIAYKPAEDSVSLNEVTTYLLPGFRHSRLFRLRDRRRGTEGHFRALRVRHEVSGTSARTKLYYGEEFERH